MDILKTLTQDKDTIATESEKGEPKVDGSVVINAGKDFRKILEMLAFMEQCGDWGHHGTFQVSFDGDGTAKINLQFKDKTMQDLYKQIQKEVKDKYGDKDPEGFYFE